MAEYSKLYITNNGQALMAKMIAGSGNIDFTKVCSSSTQYTESQLQALTALSNIKQTTLVSKVTRTNEVAIKIDAAYSNVDLKEGYYMRTLGLYAVDPDKGEILYAVCIEKSNNCYMPPYNGVTVSAAYLQLYTTVGNADSVSLAVSPGAYATVGDIQALEKEIADLKDFVARNKARVATRNMAMSRQKKLDKMDVIELAAEKPKPEFHFRYGRTPGKMLFETHDLVTGYDEPLSKPLNFSMERGQKIALVGTNGIGKTTLLKSILGLIPSLSGSCELGENLEIGYFEQEVKGENKTTCIDEIWQEFPSFTQYEVRSALAKCGLTTKHIESQVRVLSGGEQAKVRLCKLINRDTNILLLDEPTNHLDVDAKDSLKKALQEYRGSILLICHEPEFYQDVVNEVWDMSKWTTKVF